MTLEKKLVTSFETSHFVKNPLLYRSRSRKYNFILRIEMLKNQDFRVLGTIFLRLTDSSCFLGLLSERVFLIQTFFRSCLALVAGEKNIKMSLTPDSFGTHCICAKKHEVFLEKYFFLFFNYLKYFEMCSINTG